MEWSQNYLSKLDECGEGTKWDRRFLFLAKHISEWSKDPSTKVGAVIVDDNNRLISVGYNGFPKGILDTPSRLEIREVKYKMIIHGELNAMAFANESLEKCTLYTWPFLPCSNCAAQIIQRNLKRVVSIRTNSARWNESIGLAMDMFSEVGIEYTIYDESFLNEELSNGPL